LATRRELNLLRPSLMLLATVSGFLTESGQIRYAAEAAGLRATGDTPELAFDNFDRLWVTGESV
jgi:hypothetical protein